MRGSRTCALPARSWWPLWPPRASPIPPWSSVAGAVASPPGDALSWIEAELADNGGTLPSSFDATVTDWGLTLDAVIALHLGGRGTGAAATAAVDAFALAPGDYVTGEAFGDAGSAYAGPIGKSLYALGLLGEDVNAVGAVDIEALSRAAIVDAGDFAGRFSDVSGFGDFSNGFGQAFNVMGLAMTDGGVPAPAVEFLLDQQCPAGGFRLTYETTAGCEGDDETDTDATALAVSALLAVDPTPAVVAALDAATGWLLAAQDASGGFGGTGPTASPNANTTGLAAKALRAVGELDAARDAANFVAALQLDADSVAGTPAVDEAGAIALNEGARSAALVGGIASGARDQWRRATTQGVLALEATPAVTPLQPARLVDSRPGESTVDGGQVGGGRVAAGAELVVEVAGRAGVPAGVSGVVLNVTALGADGPGFVTVYECGVDRPTASNLNFGVGSVSPNVVFTAVSAAGTVCVFVGGTSAVHLIVDVNGFVDASSDLSPVVPARLVDSRPGESTVDGGQVGGGRVAAGAELVVEVAGRAGLPAAVPGCVWCGVERDGVGC
jgi:hypothetical protein